MCVNDEDTEVLWKSRFTNINKNEVTRWINATVNKERHSLKIMLIVKNGLCLMCFHKEDGVLHDCWFGVQNHETALFLFPNIISGLVRLKKYIQIIG